MNRFIHGTAAQMRELQARIDSLPPSSALRFSECRLTPDCIPQTAAIRFYRDGQNYCISLDPAVRYRSDDPAMTHLTTQNPVFFREFSHLRDFLRELPDPSPPQPAGTQSRPGPEMQADSDINRIADMKEVRIPKGAAGNCINRANLQRELQKEIMGQETAIETSAHQAALFLSKQNPKRPLSILAYGPSGTGKTETAKALVKALARLGLKYAAVWIDLNQFTESHSVYRLTGSPPGYVGYEDAPVFEAVTQNPRTVFVFDELDKAHPEVLKTFMSVLDEGRCSARKAQEDGSRSYDFRRCIFIFTSNYRLDSSREQRIGFSVSDEVENIRCENDSVEVRYAAKAPEDEAAAVTERIYRSTEDARKAFVKTGVLKEIASRFNCFVEFRELSEKAKLQILAKQIVETGFEYNLRLTHISSSILQGLINTAASGDALTVRSFKAMVEGYLATAFAKAGARFPGQSFRLEGSIDAPMLTPSRNNSPDG